MGQAFLAGLVWENAVLGALCSSSSLLVVGLTEAAISASQLQDWGEFRVFQFLVSL